jgi:hypothetical protein
MDKVYLGHSNTNNFILKANNSAVDLAGVTQMTLTFGSSALVSANSTASITWNQDGYATGEVRLHLGMLATLSTGIYEAPLIVYESTDANGKVWGNIPLHVMEEVEGAT